MLQVKVGDKVRVQRGIVSRGYAPARFLPVEGQLVTIIADNRHGYPGGWRVSVPPTIDPDFKELYISDDFFSPAFSAGDQAMAGREGFIATRRVVIVRPSGDLDGRGVNGHFRWLANDGEFYYDYELSDAVEETSPREVCRHHAKSTGVTVPAPHLLPNDPLGAVREQELAMTERLGEAVFRRVRAGLREWPICPLTSGDPALKLVFLEDRVAKTITGVWRCETCKSKGALSGTNIGIEFHVSP
jgi:hypothetical protein